MTSRAEMRHDLHEFLPDMTRRVKLATWVEFYWWPTKRWMPKVAMWWHYNVRRYPKLPPLAKDRIGRHHGFVEGVPPCTDGPVCAEHGWELSPLVAPPVRGKIGEYELRPVNSESSAPPPSEDGR